MPPPPDFSKHRHGRFRDSGLFRWLLNEVLRRCIDVDRVKGDGFAVDASIVKTDAGRQRGLPGAVPVKFTLTKSSRDEQNTYEVRNHDFHPVGASI